ncbi:hypothetical protein GCM10010446_66820 [Streptomyces enissocaesilis]|uniref:Uncharacterized protein n=1 Tax=Streptomyces enissocaesilis TaxID=332589 RepID=A0ABN3XPQ9_9ACTN
MRFAVNFLAPMALSELLIPLLEKAPQGRVVNVGSTNQGYFDMTDTRLDHGYSGATAYRRSKTALAAGTFLLAERLRNSRVTVNCVHPATRMDTAMVRDSGVVPTSSVESGAEAVLRAVKHPKLANVTGEFFDGEQSVRAHEQCYDPNFRAWLADAVARYQE